MSELRSTLPAWRKFPGQSTDPAGCAPRPKVHRCFSPSSPHRGSCGARTCRRSARRSRFMRRRDPSPTSRWRRCVATVSAPLDLVAVSRVMERIRTLPYRAYVLRALVRQGQAFARLYPARVRYDARALTRLRTIRAYDEEVIAPMHDFASAHDY